MHIQVDDRKLLFTEKKFKNLTKVNTRKSFLMELDFICRSFILVRDII